MIQIAKEKYNRSCNSCGKDGLYVLQIGKDDRNCSEITLCELCRQMLSMATKPLSEKKGDKDAPEVF